MKQKLLIAIISAVFVFATAGGGMAEDKSHDMGHKMSMEKTDQGMHQMKAGKDGGMMDMDMGHSGQKGKDIHNSVVDGYHLSYRLMDIREKMAAAAKKMKAEGNMHEGMDATHHLMLFVKNPRGAGVENAKVGYLITGPDGATQKHMCMAMGGGYGSDIKLAGSGDYTIKAKAEADGKEIVDEFTYTVK